MRRSVRIDSGKMHPAGERPVRDGDGTWGRSKAPRDDAPSAVKRRLRAWRGVTVMGAVRIGPNLDLGPDVQRRVAPIEGFRPADRRGVGREVEVGGLDLRFNLDQPAECLGQGPEPGAR